MATIKSYTDLEQSKKLAKILPLESADMYWFRDNIETPEIYPKNMMKDSVSVTLPCWSLAALLGALPDYTLKSNEFYGKVALWCQGISVEYDNPVDACVTMVEKLNELNLL